MNLTSSLAPERTQVLVVGAGPVGLLAALRLRHRGVSVRIIDQQPEQRAHSFPVILHPQSLRLLADLGVTAAMYWRGRPVTRLALYTDQQRRAVLELPTLRDLGAGVLTLPQDVLRQALASALNERGVSVEYDTRLSALEQDGRGVWGRLAHDVPGRLNVGARRSEVRAFQADFVIGADGYQSTVREALGLELRDYGRLESYAFFDAEVDGVPREAQLAITDDACSSIYPIQGGQARFSFQLSGSLHRTPDLSMLRELIQSRMPWLKADVVRCDWCGVAEFRHGLVTSFGHGRVWLAGDAAHVTSPLGVQSLNIGLDEASDLALRIADALEQPYAPGFGAHYDAHRRRQWRALLGLADETVPRPLCREWTKQHLEQLLPCLPASGQYLEGLLEQLRVTRATGSSHA